MTEAVLEEEPRVDVGAVASRIFDGLEFRNLFEGVRISQTRRFTFTHLLGLDLRQEAADTARSENEAQTLGRRLLLMEHRARQKTGSSVPVLGEWAVRCFVLDLDNSVCYPGCFAKDPHARLPFPDFSQMIDEQPHDARKRLEAAVIERSEEAHPLSALSNQAVYLSPWGEALMGLDRGIGPL